MTRNSRSNSNDAPVESERAWYPLEHSRQPERKLETRPVRRAILDGWKRLRERGDQLTGDGLRSLTKRQLRRLRSAGDRLTGGGLRALARRVLTASLRRGMSRSALKALVRSVLQAFPRLSQRLYHIAKVSELPMTSAKDRSLLVHSLYRVAFGRSPDESGLTHHICALQSGTPLEILAEHLVGSPEFKNRYGSSQELDIPYITALYRDGLGRPPGLDSLAFWLAQGNEGATRAKVLAAVAASEEALARADSPTPAARMDYNRWVSAFDTISDADRAVIRAHIANLPRRPVISVIMAVGATSEVPLQSSFNSVITQLYPNWELCIAAEQVAAPLLDTILSSPASRNPRIRVTRSRSDESLALAINAALRLATGEFVTFLSVGDLLAEHALYEVALELGRTDRTDIVYTDHDEIGPGGHRSNPWFKPGWDPDLLLAQNYTGDLTVYRRTLVEAAGFMREGFDGAEFHDLALRATSATAPDCVGHIPSILYHRRTRDRANDSHGALSDLRAITAAHRVVREHLDSRGYSEAILKRAPQVPTAIRVVWPFPEPPPLVSILVPTRDRADLLAKCAEGVLHRTEYSNLELLIIDNGSVEPATFALFERLTREDRRVRILNIPGPFNYSALNNAAAREARGEILLLLNNDIDVIGSDWLRELVSHVLRPDVGVVGAKLLYANEQLQHGGVVLGPNGQTTHVHRFATRNDPGYFGQLALTRTLSAVTGACAAIRREVFFEVGGLDEVNFQVAFNDIDLCLRAGDYGYRVIWTPFAELFHLESVSRGREDADPVKSARFLRERQQLRNTWGSLLESADPFHNPNLLFAWDYFEAPTAPRREKPWRHFFEQIWGVEKQLFKHASLSAG